MSDKKKSAKKWQDKLDKQSEKSEEKKRKREAAFVPPKVRMSSCIFSVGFSFACVVTKSCYGFQENTQSTKTTDDNNGIADIAKSLKVHCYYGFMLCLFSSCLFFLICFGSCAVFLEGEYAI
jgi:ribosomal RNA assembly protein